LNSWIESLNLDDLKFEAPVLFVLNDNPEDAALFLYREGYPSPMNAVGEKERFQRIAEEELQLRPPKKYWEWVKDEIRILICTDDPKYKKLRDSLRNVNEKGTEYIVTAISSAIGSKMGVEAGVISAFCAVLLHSAAKVGVEAYCASTSGA
jgi:hypothetical protein